MNTASDILMIDIIGYLACAFTVISLIPQLAKILTSRSSNDISVPMFVWYLSAQILWITYGFYIIDLKIIITNVLCALSTSLIIIFSISFFRTS